MTEECMSVADGGQRALSASNEYAASRGVPDGGTGSVPRVFSVRRYLTCLSFALAATACGSLAKLPIQSDASVDPGLGGADGGPNSDGGLGDAGTAPLDGGLSDGGVDSGQDGGQDAGPTAIPDRIVFFYVPHGMYRPNWLPTGDERTFSLPPILAPLANLRHRLIVIDGLDLMPTPAVAGGSFAGHGYGQAAILTGSVSQSSAYIPFPGSQPYFLPATPSLDQILARNERGAVPSLVLTPRPFFTMSAELSRREVVTYGDGGEPVFPESNLTATYNTLFGDAGIRTPLLTDLEQRVQRADGGFATALPLQLELVKEAFRHDRTRVVAVQVTGQFAPFIPSWLGLTRDYHNILHDVDSTQKTLVQTYFVSVVADFATSLDGIQVGGGQTLLDHTLIVFISETGGETQAHGRNDIPVFLLGNVSGKLDTGRFVTFNRLHVDLLLTIGQLFDPTMTTIGDSAYQAMPISSLRR